MNSDDIIVEEIFVDESQISNDNFIDVDIMDEMLRDTFEDMFDTASPSIETQANSETELPKKTIDRAFSQKVYRYPITVSIGTTHISKSKFNSLKVEDIIALDQVFDIPIILKTSNKQTFRGKLGKVKERFAIKLL